jgi:protein-tyrosine phosphatase
VIDLHCHLLPGIDDGARDMADSVAMARVAADDGIEAICATPHIRHDHDVRIHELAERAGAVQEELRRTGVPVRVLTGGEVAETALGGLDDRELMRVSLGGGGWILLEPAPGALGDSLERAVGELLDRGYRSLIAHPERHGAGDLAERLARLVDRGALVQVTADSLLDPDVGSWMLDLAAGGLVHVVASDSHSSRYGRPVRIAAAIERLREVEPARAHLDWIANEAPSAIVHGDAVEPPFAPRPAR